MSTITAIIDADVLIFQACSATEEVFQWDSEPTYNANLSRAIDHLESKVGFIKKALEADHVVMALSDYREPWRKNVLSTYKANRKHLRKPEGMEALRNYCHEAYDTYQFKSLEGDDVVGLLMTAPDAAALIEGKRIAVSIDKDLKTIPGWHFNPKTETLVHVSTLEADLCFMTQALTGDDVDGYKGCPNIGPKKASKLLEGRNTVSSMWSAVVSAYAKKGLTVNDALVQARVARILRWGEYNFDTNEVILWRP